MAKAKMMDEDKVRRLREADFWTALVLLGLAGLMLRGALGFPITDSYGGVQNVWYVSPALFPLLVTVALALLASVLLVNAIRTGGAARALRGVAHWEPGIDRGLGKLVLMGALLVGYVFGFIPYVDYVVGTAFFLLAFVTAFHLGDITASRWACRPFLAAAGLAAILGPLGLMPSPGTGLASLADGLVLVGFVSAMALVFATATAPRRDVLTVLAIALATPLFLAPAFKYFLLVPLPREGLVVGWMDTLRYALRAALA